MKLIQFLTLFVLTFFLFACSSGLEQDSSMQESESNKRTGEVTDIKNPNEKLDFSESDLKTIYFAGGCFWGVDAYFERIFGVAETKSGYANGNGTDPSYETVISGEENFVEAVKVDYDPKRVSIVELLDYLFKVIDPTLENQQGNDIGVQYRTGIYYIKNDQEEIIQDVVSQKQKNYEDEIVTEVLPLENFYLAEEMHQDYLEKNPDGYCHINLDVLNEVNVNPDLYEPSTLSETKEKLNNKQFEVTMEDETETAYENEYWDTYEPGIYVDVVTGEPLFSSNTKYEANCGWPSFTKPIDAEALNFSEDTSENMKRTEVRSRVGDIHLGHVFDDGPEEEGGQRYCINSASLKFIHVDDMKKEGYEHLIHIVK